MLPASRVQFALIIPSSLVLPGRLEYKALQPAAASIEAFVLISLRGVDFTRSLQTGFRVTADPDNYLQLGTLAPSEETRRVANAPAVRTIRDRDHFVAEVADA